MMNVRRVKLYLCCALAVFALALLACSPRVSYSVKTLHIDPAFSGRQLNEVEIALLPFLSSKGSVMAGELESGKMAESFRSLRKDLKFVSYGEFEERFPARFDRREIAEFYRAVFREEVLAAKAMDSIWEHIEQPYFLVCGLVDGAQIRHMDGSVFKHAGVKCELWSREGREAVWRAVCKGVSDDKNTPDTRLFAESMRRLAEEIPGAMPNYGQENW